MDTAPLGLLTQRRGKSLMVDQCVAWSENLLANGIHIYVPEIADYEVRRELLQTVNSNGINRLDILCSLARYLPITTVDMHQAAALWAKARAQGQPTADRHALDGDVILAAQAISLGLTANEFVVATSNSKHLSRFVPAMEWHEIGADYTD